MQLRLALVSIVTMRIEQLSHADDLAVLRIR
jgi:hypothetical protein